MYENLNIELEVMENKKYIDIYIDIYVNLINNT